MNEVSIFENVLVAGDLSQLSPDQRISYYNKVCESLGLNPLTKPFEYIRMNNKLVLYAKRDCTDQLRKKQNVSIKIISREKLDDVFMVVAEAQLTTGRVDSAIGAVNIKGLHGDNLANALMKAETKAKRRVTLSICGLGFLDETEVETIPSHPASQEAPISKPQVNYGDKSPDTFISIPQGKRLFAIARSSNWSTEDLKTYLKDTLNVEHTNEIKWRDYDRICKYIEQNPPENSQMETIQ